MEPSAGTCGWCGKPLEGRVDKAYCKASCRRSARRKRKRDRERSNSLSPAGLTYNEAGTRAADARFRAMIDADEASRVPDLQAREWAAYARRHGTIHPDEQAAGIARGRQARADDWQQGTVRFVREGGSIADAGRRARSQQIRPATYAPSGGPASWDDDDPEQPGETVDLGDWRRGRKR